MSKWRQILAAVILTVWTGLVPAAAQTPHPLYDARGYFTGWSQPASQAAPDVSEPVPKFSWDNQFPPMQDEMAGEGWGAELDGSSGDADVPPVASGGASVRHVERAHAEGRSGGHRR